VADVVGQIAELSKGTNGIWTKFTNELAALGANIRSQPETRNQPHTAQIILGSSHADLIRQARDESKNRIFVTSHRFGIAGKPSVIAPTLTAAIARGINVQIYYGTTSGPLKGSDAAEITSEVGRKGVVIRPIRKPRLHAKLLAWDDETIIVTSQNWLSADPPDYDPRQEIGVRITAPNLARKLIERFEMAKIE
ncbi:MAG: phospholipase D-like domain-containing protein, partial [Cyclobacteriaceae bacterium]